MKKLFIISLCIFLSITLVSCFGNYKNSEGNNINLEDDSRDTEASNAADEDNSTEEYSNSEDPEFIYNSDYISEHLNRDFSITYNFTYYEDNSKAETVTILLKKNDNGYYFKLSDGSEFMYLKDGDVYALCVINEETGIFSKMDGITMTEEEVKGSAESVLGYLSFYETYIDDLKKDGSETICEHSCDKYILNSASWGVSSKIEYYIDKETGVCLKYLVEAAAGKDRSGFDYECTEFSFENVTLPECDN